MTVVWFFFSCCFENGIVFTKQFWFFYGSETLTSDVFTHTMTKNADGLCHGVKLAMGLWKPVQILAEPIASEESDSTCAPQPLCNSCDSIPDLRPSTPIMSGATCGVTYAAPLSNGSQCKMDQKEEWASHSFLLLGH